jgi:hypothetical protein
MSIKYEKLSKGETFLVNWQYRVLKDEAMELASSIAKSDTGNRKVFAYFFPEYTQAITDFQSKSGYWPNVEVKAGLLSPNWEKEFEMRQSIRS